MSEPIRKPRQAPESNNPKNKPEIIRMVENAPYPTERLVETFAYNGVAFEVVERPEALWVGCLDYAKSNESEPDGDSLLARYQKYLDIVKRDLVSPDWSASLWFNYGCHDKPRGQMFAQETYSASQDGCYEVFTQPGGLWLRVRRSKETSLALFGNESIDAWDYFVSGVMQKAAEKNGYKESPDVYVRIGYDCHAEYNTPPHTCYAYIPIIKDAYARLVPPKRDELRPNEIMLKCTLSCNVCTGGKMRYYYQYQNGKEIYRCGAYPVLLPDITKNDVEGLKRLIAGQHSYFLSIA